MSDWSNDAARRSQQKRHQEQIEKERPIREERLLWTKARPLWDILRKTLIQKCVEFNEEGMCERLAWSRGDLLELAIEDSRHKYISLSFDFQRHSVSTKGATSDCYRIAVVPDTYEVTFMDSFQSRLTVDQLAERILENLLDIQAFQASL
jgi:hypothetical protein